MVRSTLLAAALIGAATSVSAASTYVGAESASPAAMRRANEFDALVQRAYLSARDDKTTVNNNSNNKNTNIDKSTNNNANLSHNSGVVNNSGNTVNKKITNNTTNNNSCSLQGRSLDFEPRSAEELAGHATLVVRHFLETQELQQQLRARDANSDWLKAGAQFQIAQTDAIADQVKAQAALAKANQPSTCKCQCARRRDLAPASASGAGAGAELHARAQSEVSIGGPGSVTLVARLEPECSIVQETFSGRHVYSGACSHRSTVNGRSITEALQPALEFSLQ